MSSLNNFPKVATQQGCSLGLERLGLETVSRHFFERLGLVSIPSLQSLGFVSVSASYVSFTTLLPRPGCELRTSRSENQSVNGYT